MAKKKEVEKAVAPTLDSDEGGVKIETKGEAFHISFPYKRELISAMRAIEGAAFDKEQKSWVVPTANQEAVKAGVENLRGINKSLDFDHTVAIEAAKLKFPDASVKDAFTRDNQRTTGAIVAITDHYVVQQKNAKEIVVHEKSSLDKGVEIGDTKSLYYSKGHCQVQERTARVEKVKEQARAM